MSTRMLNGCWRWTKKKGKSYSIIIIIIIYVFDVIFNFKYKSHMHKHISTASTTRSLSPSRVWSSLASHSTHARGMLLRILSVENGDGDGGGSSGGGGDGRINCRLFHVSKYEKTNGRNARANPSNEKKMRNVFYFRIPFRCTLIIFVIQFPLTCLDNVLLKSKWKKRRENKRADAQVPADVFHVGSKMGACFCSLS